MNLKTNLIPDNTEDGIPDHTSSGNVLNWHISLAEIMDKQSYRFDAEHYDPSINSIMSILEQSGRNLTPLSEWADLVLPNQFVRIWADGPSYGVPYVNATDLMCITALGKPSDDRFLSYASEVNIDKLRIKTGYLLMTCSGTIGRIFSVPNFLNNWVATHDLIRIVPKNKKHRGYLHAYLSSEIAQKQIQSHTHGGQIDHITEIQIGTLLVPDLTKSEMNWFADNMDKATSAHESGLCSLSNIIDSIEGDILGKHH